MHTSANSALPVSKFQSDPEGSTYKHYIFLDPTHPDNKHDVLEGYSKDRRSIEPADKEALLMSKTRDLHWGRYLKPDQNGLHRALRVGICVRPDRTVCTWEQQTLILSLFRDGFEIESQADVTNKVSAFLENFYAAIKAGNDVSKMLVFGYQKGKAYEQTHKDLMRYKSLKTVEELVAFYRQRLKDGHNPEVMKAFYKEYMQKHFSDVPNAEVQSIYDRLLKSTGK